MAKVKFVASLFAIVAIGVVGVAYSKWDEWTVWPELRKPILASLKDPDSALFRNQYVGRRALCGEVNARNALGGYTGYPRFIAAGAQFALEKGDLNTWYTKSSEIEGLTTALDKQIELMQSMKRKPTDAEISRAIFVDLWRERCAGIV